MLRSTIERALVAYSRRFPVNRGKLRLVDAGWRAAVGASEPTREAVLIHGDFRVSCDLREMLQRQLYFFGTYFVERENLRCWTTAAASARVVFDVGANAGIYSLAALAAAPASVVHAFEPTPEIAARLRETARRNRLDGLHVHEMAVSSAPGVATLHRFRGENGENGGMNYVTMDAPDATAEPVAAVSLDAFCDEGGIDRIDLLKLDIQGNEARALEGARRVLNAGRIGVIFTELNWTEPRRSSPANDTIRLLVEAGYWFSPPTRPFRWVPVGDWLHALEDIVAVHDPNGLGAA